MSDDVKADLTFLQETLHLDPDAQEYQLLYGLVPDKNQIVVLTASILEIINELAWRVDVPPVHVEEGRTTSTFVNDDSTMAPLIRIHHSAERPVDSYVAVRIRDTWFYIDDRDVISKRTFAILQVMLSLTDSDDAARGPVVSISN